MISFHLLIIIEMPFFMMSIQNCTTWGSSELNWRHLRLCKVALQLCHNPFAFLFFLPIYIWGVENWFFFDIFSEYKSIIFFYFSLFFFLAVSFFVDHLSDDHTKDTNVCGTDWIESATCVSTIQWRSSLANNIFILE